MNWHSSSKVWDEDKSSCSSWASCLAWGKKHNAFSPVKISLFAILLEKHQLNCLKHNTGPFTKHLLPLCYQQSIDKTSSNLIMCRMPQIAKRPLQHHSNVRCNLVFSCFVLCFSCSEIIYSDLKYIVYVFMNALEHCETPISYFISVQGRSCKEIKKKLPIFFYNIAPLHKSLWLLWQFSNPWHHNFRKEDRRKIEMFNQKTLHVYNLRWCHGLTPASS